MIEISDYQSEWQRQFLQIRNAILPALSEITTQIEHVGSTSVPGLPAKPIIDIDVVITSKSDFNSVKSKLEAMGYQYLGDQGVPYREAFRCRPEDINHHLYVCEDGILALQNHITLRDHLRKNVGDRNRYGILKRKLAKQFKNDIDAYVEGKTNFIIEILSKYGIKELDEIIEVNQKSDDKL
ncbi:GrpB family protein [Chloroflexi bacterium]|nr:GrpB family protein [Chloroflexota bacterium]